MNLYGFLGIVDGHQLYVKATHSRQVERSMRLKFSSKLIANE